MEAQRFPRILLVEDDAHIRRAGADVLVRSGYQVDMAEDGAVAWEVLQQQDYDLLLTDNHMCRLSGIGLIKKLYDAGKVMPVILMSVSMPVRELGRHSWLKLEALLFKPFSAEELVETVNVVMEATGLSASHMGPNPQGGKDHRENSRLV